MKIIQKATQKVGKKLKLGGSIPDDVRKLDVYTPGFDYRQVLRDAAYLKGAPRPKEYLHGVIPMIPRNSLGWHTFPVVHTSEEEFHTSLMSSVSGRGASGDHPTVQRAVFESLKDKPDLAQIYMNS